jgi:predicted acyl esterase
MRLGGVLLTLPCVLAIGAGVAEASVVDHGYLTLGDGTRLGYTLTRPSATGRFPVVLKYDPYSAGVTSDPTWNPCRPNTEPVPPGSLTIKAR